MGLRSFRRSAAVACVALGAVVVTGVSVPVGADEEFVPGSGEVEARLIRVGPTAGRLSFAPAIGNAYAAYQNSVSRAQSRYFDFAALDDSIPPEVAEAAPVAQVDSTEEGAEQGIVINSAGASEQSPVRAGTTRQEVRASSTPMGEAVFILGDFAPVPDTVELTGGRAVTRAGIVDGATRQAEAVVSFGRIALGGGAVVLQGATWSVRQRTGAHESAAGSFHVEGISVAGQGIKPPEDSLTGDELEPLNEALAPLGLRIDLPKVTVEKGIVNITPLRIRITATEVGRTVGPSLLEALQPLREPITEQLIAQSPEAASLITLADVAMGAIVGSGAVDLELGGATAYTEGESFDDPFAFDLGSPAVGPPSPGGGGPIADVGSFEPGAADVPDGSDLVDEAPAPSGGDGEVALTDTRRGSGSTGGAALVVGLLGLLAVLAMAAADWWRMHHEPRRIALP